MSPSRILLLLLALALAVPVLGADPVSVATTVPGPFDTVAVNATPTATGTPVVTATPKITEGAGTFTVVAGMKITVPGTYTLDRDLVQDDAHPVVLEVACSNVVIQGNGHRVVGDGRPGFPGVYAASSAGSLTGVVVRDLTVTNCFYGIYLADVDGARIERCQVLETPSGGMGLVLAAGSDGTTVTGCRILSAAGAGASTYGLVLASSSMNSITDNEFCNPANVLLGGTVGVNAWNGFKTAGTNIVGGPYRGGNYWDTPDGTGWSRTVADADHDGIGDGAYVLAAGNTDSLPLVKDRPAASFSANATSGLAPCTVAFSDTSTGAPTSWAWSFGDGGTSAAKNPLHTYTAPGDYTVSLTVRNGAGYTDTETRPSMVTVAPPISVRSITPATGVQGSLVTVPDLAGTGFLPGASVRLERAGCTGIGASWVSVLSPSRISFSVRVPFTAGTSAAWSVVVTNTDGTTATLPAGFTATRPSAAIVIAEPGSFLLANDIDASAQTTCIEIRSSGVDLDGAGHRVEGVGTRNSAGVMVRGLSGPLSNVTVRDLQVRDWWYGVSLQDADGSTVRNATLSENGYAGAVIFRSSTGVRIEGCTVGQNDYGVAFLDGSNGGTVRDCAFGGNVRGLYVYLSDGMTVTHNAIEDSGECGIQYHVSEGGTIYDNRLENACNVIFTGEPFKANAWSVSPRAGPNVEGGAEVGGNFWGAPDGTGFSQTNPDGDGDGFVDYPFQVAELNVDEFPLAPRGPAAPAVVQLPGGANTPTDPDRDGVCEDVNGNGRADFADVVLYFNSMTWVAANEPVAAFDYNANGRIDFADVVRLFDRL